LVDSRAGFGGGRGGGIEVKPGLRNSLAQSKNIYIFSSYLLNLYKLGCKLSGDDSAVILCPTNMYV
jgi:hypothetical protein